MIKKREVRQIGFDERMYQTTFEITKAMKFNLTQLNSYLGFGTGYLAARTTGGCGWKMTDAYVYADKFGYSLNYLVFGTGPHKLLEAQEKKQETPADELLVEFSKRAKKDGFAVAGCWLENRISG